MEPEASHKMTISAELCVMAVCRSWIWVSVFMVSVGLWVGVSRRKNGENDLAVGDLGLHLPRDGEASLLKPIARDADKGDV
jgi:hypothetical protein